jgi:cytidylate kinase
MPTPIIAIDGPSGAGKGTVARAVAEALGYRHVDTGAMYRAVAWKAVHDALDLADEPALATLAREAAILVEGGVVAIDDQEVTRDIRTPEIDAAASSVARLPGVRAALVARQRALAVEGGLVMEGRDIGTVVFPQADVKIYLDASEAERVRRRTHDPARDHRPLGPERQLLLHRRREEPGLAEPPDDVLVERQDRGIEEGRARDGALRAQLRVDGLGIRADLGCEEIDPTGLRIGIAIHHARPPPLPTTGYARESEAAALG